MKKQNEGGIKDIERLNNEIEERNKQMQVFKINQLSEMSSLEEEILSLEAQLSQRNSEIIDLKEEFEKEKNFHIENYNESKRQIEDLDKIKTDLEDLIRKLNHDIENKTNENRSLMGKIQEEKDNNANLLREYDELLKDKNKDKELIDRIIMEKELKIENINLKHDKILSEASKEQVNLKEKIEELEKKMIQKEILITQLNSDLENKDNIISHFNEDVKQCLESRNATLSLELGKKEDEIKILEKQVKSFEEKIEDLNQDLEKKKKNLEESSQEVDILRNSIAEDQLKIKQLEEFKEKSLQEKIDISESHLKTEHDISAKTTQLPTKLNLDNNALSNANSDTYSISKDKINYLNNKLSEEKAKNKVLCDEFRKLKENLSVLNLANSKKERVIEANIKVIQELKLRLQTKIKIEETIMQNKSQANEATCEPNSICSICLKGNLNKLNFPTVKSSNKSFSRSHSLNEEILRNKSTLFDLENINLECEKVPKIKQNNNNGNSNAAAGNIAFNSINTAIRPEGKARVTFEQFNLCKMLIVENLLLNYQISQSISLNFVVDVIIKNFNFFINSIFSGGNKSWDNKKEVNKNKNIKENNSASNIPGVNIISIFHEFLEDIILKIYNQGIKSKKTEEKNDEIAKENKESSSLKKTLTTFFMGKSSLEANKEENKTHHLSKEDFCFDLIKTITAEISENNIINNLVSVQRTTRVSMDELFRNFLQKYEKYFDYEFLNISSANTKYYEVVDINLEDYLNKEIKSVFIENLKNLGLLSKNKIQLLIDKILLNLQDGNLISSIEKNSIYNFKYFNREYSQFNFMLRNTNKEQLTQLCPSQDEISTALGANFKEHYNTLIMNLGNIEQILSNRHSLDYFNFLIKSYGCDINKVIIKGETKKNIDLTTLHALFLNIFLYSKHICKISINDIFLSSDNNIRENENLRRMSIYKEPINHSLLELVNFINFSTNIRHLSISNCSIGDEGCKFLCKNFTNFNLVELNLSNNQLEDSSGFYIAELLPKLSQLQNLSLSLNSINSSGFAAICTAISQMQATAKAEENLYGFSLKFLDLSHNSLNQVECRSFVDFMVKYGSLEELDLSGNEFDPQCANSMGIYLKNCKGLKKINLSKCALNEESCPLLIKNLEVSLIESLIFDDNPIGQIGAILFANLLRVNKNLKTISLRSCSIPGMTIPIILKQLDNCVNLVEIDLRGNTLIYQEFTMLNMMIEGKNIRVLIDQVTPPQRK